MKFCENCGAKLADDAAFCEECGARQSVNEIPVEESVMPPVEIPEVNPAVMQAETAVPKLSETCTPAKREIKGWVLTILLILFCPYFVLDLILVLPDALFWIVFAGTQLAAMILLWKKRSWNVWIKIIITGVYILSYLLW